MEVRPRERELLPMESSDLTSHRPPRTSESATPETHASDDIVAGLTAALEGRLKLIELLEAEIRRLRSALVSRESELDRARPPLSDWWTGTSESTGRNVDLARTQDTLALTRGPNIDICPAEIRLGRGWYDLEDFGGEHFRWIHDAAEFSIPQVDDNAWLLELDLAAGPSLGRQPIELSIVTGSGDVVFSTAVSDRCILRIPCPSDASADRTFFLQVDQQLPRHPIADDERQLDLRVFSLRLARRVSSKPGRFRMPDFKLPW